MDEPEPDTHPTKGSATKAGRFVFWAGAGFCTVAAPWMLGGQPLTAQWCLLIGSALAFFGGLSVHLTGAPTPGARTAFRTQRTVLIFGLLFVAYVAWQAINPSLMVVFRSNRWMLLPVESAHPGPHSIQAPFTSLDGDYLPYKNAWRFLLIFGSVWLYAAGMALGLKDRQDARRWVFIVGANAFLIALVCIAHRAMGARLTLWHYSDTVAFTGSPVFFYKNHNGEFLAASLAAILGIAWTAENLSQRRIWETAALVVWVATVAVNSRAATGLATVWLIVYAAMRFWKSRRENARHGAAKGWRFGAIGAAAAFLIIAVTNGRTVIDRFSPALSAPIDFIQGGTYRGLLRQVGWEIWEDEPVWGWGGGSFMYLFGNYESRVPELRAEIYRTQPNLNRFYMFSADSDWIEFLVEYGLVGVALLCAALGVGILAWLGWQGWKSGAPLFLLLGAIGIVLHGYLDHIFRNPALSLLLAGLFVVALRLAAPRHSRRQTERSGIRG